MTNAKKRALETSEAGCAPPHDDPYVLVMCAMEEEASFMRDRMNDCSEVPLTGAMRRTRGSIGGMAVDLVVSGIGTVYGTLATTAAVLDRKPIAVLSCGCSGAHVRDLRMGDVVLASEVVPLDAIVLERGGKVRRTGVRRSMQDPQVQSWHADTTLLQHAKVAADQVARRRTASGGRALTYMTGAVGSSDTWRQSPQVIEQIHSETQSLCEEMEAGAVAQVAHSFGVPFLGIKDIANNELNPEPLQLEPEHTLANECSGVQLGLAAAEVTVGVIEMCAAA